jgi:hypothetical protein
VSDEGLREVSKKSATPCGRRASICNIFSLESVRITGSESFGWPMMCYGNAKKPVFIGVFAFFGWWDFVAPRLR